MAILYSKNRKAAETPSHGFNLIFTDGTTYDLDALSKNKNRSDTDTALLLKIIDDKDIKAKVIEEVMSIVRTSVSDIMDTEAVQQKIAEIIADATSKYGLVDFEEIPEQVYEIVNREVDRYLRTVFDTYGVRYKVLAFDATRAEIRYTLTDANGDVPGGLEQLVNERLDLYLSKYKENIVNVEEGSLNLTNIGKRRTVGTEDYKKYLLGEEFGKEKSTEGYSPNVTGRRPIIIWENGTLDTSGEGEEAIDVYGSIDELNKTVADHSIKIDGSLADLSKFQFEHLNINDAGAYDLADVEDFELVQEHVMILHD